MSYYLFELGTPVTLAKKKEDADEVEEIKIFDITSSLLNDKMRYQDFPMIAIMLIHFISTLGSGNNAEFSVSLIQICSTALSIMSGMVSLRWAEEGKGIDIRNIIRQIQSREIDYQKREENSTVNRTSDISKIKRFRTSNYADEGISSDTDKSNNSNCMGDVLEELEMLSLQQETVNPLISTGPVDVGEKEVHIL